MPIVKDRVKQTTTTTGTGSVALSGAVSGFQTFAQAFSSGSSVYYCIADGTNWEVGSGTFTAGSPGSLSRDTILDSSNSGSAVSWSVGTKDVFVTFPAAGLWAPVDSIADLRALTSASLTGRPTIHVRGYYSPGDGGGGIFFWDATATTTDNGGTVIALTAGGVGRWRRVLTQPINVRWFGARGDGVSDDTAVIRKAIAAATGKHLYVPTGKFLVGATSGTEIFLLNHQIKITGDGGAIGLSEISVSSTTPATVDVFRVSPDVADDVNSFYGWGVTDLTIRPQSGSPARAGINIDLGAGQFLAKANFERNWIGPFGDYCIRQGKTGGSDGFFTSVIADNVFLGGGGGLLLDSSGDSLKILRNTITGSGLGLYTAPISGAAIQIIEHNNITSAGGAVVVVNGAQVKIIANQIEQAVAYAGTYNAAVTLLNCTSCDVVGNNINGHGRVDCIRLGAGSAANRLDDNLLSASVVSTKYHLRLDADTGSLNLLSGRNQFMADSADYLQPYANNLATTAQIGIWATATLQNGWNTSGLDASFVRGIQYRINDDRSVSLRGSIVGGTLSAGTAIATLPAGARPLNSAVWLRVTQKSGGAWTAVNLFVDAAGAVRVGFSDLASAAQIVVDGARFDTY